jgi:hypothetical protein
MAKLLLEERLAHLEADVALLKTEMQGMQGTQDKNEGRFGVIGRTKTDALESIFGVFANNPEADKVFLAIETEREQERIAALQEVE